VLKRRVDVAGIYDVDRLPPIRVAGLAAWAIGFVVYQLAAPIGATLPALATSIVVYLLLARPEAKGLSPGS
jgi:hypothetical protein